MSIVSSQRTYIHDKYRGLFEQVVIFPLRNFGHCFVFILFQIQSNPEESANEGHTSTQEELLPGENEKDVVVDCVDDEESDDQDGDDEDVRVEDVLLELVNKDSTATKVGA